MQFDSSKPKWDADEWEDEIDSEDEEDFLDSIGEEKPGVNARKYRNKRLHFALLQVAVDWRR